MRRLFTIFSAGRHPNLTMREPAPGRPEMRSDVQAEVAALWPEVTTENLRSMTDFAGFHANSADYSALK